MVRPLMPPLMHNDLLLLHFEQVRLSHRCNKNQENKGQRVRCRWTLNNKNWSERKNVHKEQSVKSGIQIIKCLKVTLNRYLKTVLLKYLTKFYLIELRQCLASPWWTADTLSGCAEASAAAEGALRTRQRRGRSRRTVASCRTQTARRPICRSLNIDTGQPFKCFMQCFITTIVSVYTTIKKMIVAALVSGRWNNNT